MIRAAIGLDTLTHSERRALRTVLVRATAGAGRANAGGDLDALVSAAPINQLPEAAALHRVSGSVLRALDGTASVPRAVQSQLATMRDQSSLRHLLVIGALSELGRAFDGGGLSWVVMKGPVVAGLLYPDVGDRTYNDLDLLLDRRDFPQAMRILEDLGYRHTIHNWALAEEMLAGQVGMTSRQVNIDLHWHLHYSRDDRRPFALDPRAMIDRARRVVVSGLVVPTLDPTDTLVTLAFHAARSDGHRLVWLKDVERSVAVDAPDFDELVRRCRAYRCAPPVGLILSRARWLLDAEIPQEIIDVTAPAALRAADRVITGAVHPVQLNERPTITRAFTRSVRSSAAASLAATPVRAARWARRRIVPAPENETDSIDEKVSYLDAVAMSSE